jgi:hypothetical protein
MGARWYSGWLAVIVVLSVFTGCSRRDYSSYYEIKEPRIREIPRQKMLVSRTTGDPSEDGGKAVGALFKMLYKIKRSVKNAKPSAPRARWPVTFDKSREEWVGLWSLPVPEEVKELPEQKEGAQKVTLEYWDYGTVAEILHTGSYADEKPTIDKLYAFIDAQGYEIAGLHEEEYAKGPGMFFKGNPGKYLTVIRYQVKKKETETDSSASPPQ